MKTGFFFKILFVCLAFSEVSCAQSETYIQPQKQTVNPYYKGYREYVIPKGAYYLVNALPKTVNKNAETDYTEELQQAINKYQVIVIPNFPILINAKGLTIPSNRTVYFGQYSKIIFRGPAIGRLNDIIKIYDVSNVKIYNANIIGSRNEKNAQKGEWSAGICILNSTNVEINNFQIKDTWGDGIFVGSENGKVSSNVFLKNGYIDHARRDGISITSANNLTVDAVFIANTFGTLPMTGLHIEPSLHEETIKNISLSNIYTYNNRVGFGVNLQAFSVKNKPQKEVTVKMINHIDEASSYSFGTSINNSDSMLNPTGTIAITNSTWKNPVNDFFWKNSDKYGVKIIFDKIKKYKKNKLVTQ
jgi:hypothetical protein